VALHDAGEDVGRVIPMLNRLSDALFVLARWLNARAGVADAVWRRLS
jgi:cob(I)alamin adenosyltransferase